MQKELNWMFFFLSFHISIQILHQPGVILTQLWTTQTCTTMHYVYVVVNFLSQLIFIFLLFWGMVMYAYEFETKEKQKLTKIKN